MVERQADAHPVPFGHPDVAAGEKRIVDEIAMGEHHTFWRARRAGSVLDVRRIVRQHAVRRQIAAVHQHRRPFLRAEINDVLERLLRERA